ncbi:MAG TPA: class I SAM-dependent methyltransferase [Candidatus Elarobacter sp.]
MSNCRLADGVWTMVDGTVNFDEKVRRVVQIARDFGLDLRDRPVLELGAGEGGMSLELAAHGARVVSVEGREANIAKARFAAAALGLTGITFIRDDVRRYDGAPGTFDIVLCSGLFYHLDAPSAVRLAETMARLTDRLAIIDTHVSDTAAEAVHVGGVEYRGKTFVEHEPGATPEQKAARAWASLDNDTSFWFTRPSLLNLLQRSGFTATYEAVSPLVYDFWDRSTGNRVRYADRATFVAVKTPVAHVQTCPHVNAVPARPLPEPS